MAPKPKLNWLKTLVLLGALLLTICQKCEAQGDESLETICELISYSYNIIRLHTWFWDTFILPTVYSYIYI